MFSIFGPRVLRVLWTLQASEKIESTSLARRVSTRFIQSSYLLLEQPKLHNKRMTC